MIFSLTLKSMKNRKLTAFLSVFSIALSICLFLGIERIRLNAKEGFTNTISQADLIVGARGGPLQLLLYSIFHMGSPTNNITYETYKKMASNRAVAWTIPISLGDNYKGYRVVGTDKNMIEHYRFRGKEKIELKEGRFLTDLFDVVLGSAVAQKFGHKLEDNMILTHGIQEDGEYQHETTPFKVKGILKPTGTPIDKSVYISLKGMEAMHMGWETGIPDEEAIPDYEKLNSDEIEPKQITAFVLRSKNRIMLLRLQRYLSTYSGEPLMAIIPAIVLGELWKILGNVEMLLLVISACVLVVGLFGIVISLYTSLKERRREIAILRSLGLGLPKIFMLLLLESITLVLSGILLGIVFLYGILIVLKPYLAAEYSVYIPLTAISSSEVKILVYAFIGGVLAGIIPGIKAGQNSLRDGLTVKN